MTLMFSSSCALSGDLQLPGDLGHCPQGLPASVSSSSPSSGRAPHPPLSSTVHPVTAASSACPGPACSPVHTCLCLTVTSLCRDRYPTQMSSPHIPTDVSPARGMSSPKHAGKTAGARGRGPAGASTAVFQLPGGPDVALGGPPAHTAGAATAAEEGEAATCHLQGEDCPLGGGRPFPTSSPT